MAEFTEGMVVRLKSGGRSMVIAQIQICEKTKEKSAVCFSQGGMEQRVMAHPGIPLQCLEVAETEKT